MRVTIALLCLTAVVYSVVAMDTWTTKNSMLLAVSDHSASVIGSRIVVVGGCSGGQTCSGSFCGCTNVTAQVQVLATATDSWSYGPAAPRERYRGSSVTLGSKVYVFGGRDVSDNLVTAVDVLDASADDVASWSWSTLAAALPSPRSDHCSFVSGGKAYVVGGYTAAYETLASVATYDAATDSWASATDMPSSRGDLGCAELDGRGYVFGGFSGTDFCAPVGALDEYNPTTNTWRARAALAHGRGDKAFVAVGGKLFVMGGEKKNATTNCSKYSYPIVEVEVYTPSTDSWELDTPIPDERFRFAAAAYGSSIYVLGGQGELKVASDSYDSLATVETLEVTGASSSAVRAAHTTVVAVAGLAAAAVMMVVL
ncbi:kelch repeat protein [Thecamonas trahens ATCC 50062]|uniref:Kelch repeat protein n=1 Tax=Thecamonas trahens ATCC 50062 TaxID=461836 RepID=A0A0L0DSZ3_THETB|nr:kelch repeat protein [Thecamonas trahens ATCC 50062]KNC55136.1 kelch repeat protein [Thecamonas trahens ATCC 50062]|eukprot:XP_013753315.1 kelch repeat protein [Thecamonas trahens ATCC 50062]